MSELTRRKFLRTTAVGSGVTASLAVGELNATPAGATPASPTDIPALGPVVVVPGQPRYEDLTIKGFNGRFTGQPESVQVLGSPNQVVPVLDEVIRAGKNRIAVRSGGHCFEDFIDNPTTQVIADISEMRSIYFDPCQQAFAVEAGATLGEIYRRLYVGWGVTIPGGSCPAVGAGGHIAGGGYGVLSRQYGLVSDHLHAVEVAVVDRSGKANLVVGTCSPQDPNHDLWWAHTGGGGGNFGIVTRYWLRSPQAVGEDPSALLPRPPSNVWKCVVTWNWSDLTEESFAQLADRYARLHSAPAAEVFQDPRLHSSLSLLHKASGSIMMDIQLNADPPDARKLLDDYIAAVTEGIAVPHHVEQYRVSWLKATQTTETGFKRYRFKTKAGLLQKPWSSTQIATVYRYLTDGGPEKYAAAAHLGVFGGAINSVSTTATAMAHRDSSLIAFYEIGWQSEQEDDGNVEWVRSFYRDVYAGTGGVPVPDADNDGSLINYPDIDMADQRWNTSGVPWHSIYYKDNYQRLQQIKDRWDPGNIFQHALSIRPPG